MIQRRYGNHVNSDVMKHWIVGETTFSTHKYLQLPTLKAPNSEIYCMLNVLLITIYVNGRYISMFMVSKMFQR